MTKLVSEAELFWLIGILEGEGCFTYHRTTPRISLCMTDKDVIEKAANIFFKLTGKEYRIDNSRVSIDKQIDLGRKEAFVVELYGDNARTVLNTIVPHMSHRRRQRIWQVLNGYKQQYKTVDIDNIVQLCLRKNG